MTRALVIHAGNVAGGVERVLTSMARLTRARGAIDLEFALVFAGPVAETLRATGATVHVVGPARASRPASVWQARRRLSALLAERRPAAAITQSAWTLGLFGGAVRRRGVPLLHWVHDALGTGHWTEHLAARRRPDLLLCNSQYSARCAQAVFPGVAHLVLYAPRDDARRRADEAREAIRRAHETRADASVIVQVGRAEPLKGHRVLLDALARVAADPRWTCWQVGAPQSPAERTYWDSLVTLARERGLGDRVRFVGARDDVEPVLRAADIYCQPNVGPEAFGLTLVEAMAAGLPVVTSSIGAAPEVLAATDNVLVPPGDDLAVAEALRQLLDDEPRRRRLGAQGIDRACTLTDPDSAHRVLVDAIERASRTPRAA